MNRGRTADTIWLVLIAGCLAVIAWGLWPQHHHHSDVGLIPPITVTDTTVNHHYTDPQVCRAVGATDRVLNRDHRTYVSLVTSRSHNDVNFGAAMALNAPDGLHYGPYGPAVTYLKVRYLTQRVTAPSAAVLASARALDVGRAHHACDYVFNAP